MSSSIDSLVNREYQYGFVTDVEADTIPPGLSEDVIRLISTKKDEPSWLLDWRLKAYRRWLTMKEPHWPNVSYEPIDYQSQSYYSAPKSVTPLQSLDEVDPELLRTYEKLGIPLNEQKFLSGVAVDAIFDSVSVGTTMKKELGELGIVFCSLGEAVREHPDLVQKYLGSVVPYSDNFFAALNSAVFSEGSFVYIPKGVRCPMELSTYFRINAEGTGQFERTLIVADEGSYVSYLGLHRAEALDEPAPCGRRRADRAEGCDDQVLDRAELVCRRQGRKGRHLQLRDEARKMRRREFQDLVDAGRDRLGDHMEISQRDPPGRQLDW